MSEHAEEYVLNDPTDEAAPEHPAMVADRKRRQEEASAQVEVFETLNELSPIATPFISQGTAKIWFTVKQPDGTFTKQAKLIPIRSVDREIVRRALQKLWPDREKARKKRIIDKNTRQVTLVYDETDPIVQKSNMDFVDLRRLYALAVPLRDSQGNLIWDPNNTEFQEHESGLAAFRALGLSENQMGQLDQAIDDLDSDADEQLEKNLDEL